jgi:hypothetical protein
MQRDESAHVLHEILLAKKALKCVIFSNLRAEGIAGGSALVRKTRLPQKMPEAGCKWTHEASQIAPKENIMPRS